MHSGYRGTAVANVCLQAFSLFPLPTPLDQRPVHRLLLRKAHGCTDIHCDWHAARQSQPFQNSRVEQRLLNPPVNPWIEALSHLLHYLRFLVELWPVRTKFRTRGTSLSFPPRPLVALCFHHVCHVIEQGVVLVCRHSHNFHIRWGSPGTSFWMKMFLHLKLINYYRRDTTSLSYFCLIIITRHTRFKPLDTPTFC